MSEITDWITAVATAFSTVGIGFAYSQLRMSQNIAQLKFEDSMAKEYRDLVNRLPTKALLGATLSEDEYQNAFDDLFHYIDLSNEQVFLRQQNRVRIVVWENWNKGIQHNLSLPAFHQAWCEIKSHSISFQELKALERADFKTDPLLLGNTKKSFCQMLRKLVLCFLCLFLFTGVANAVLQEDILKLHSAAEQGDVSAQCMLGSIYYEGDSVTMDYAEAAKWFRLASEQGDAAAQLILGIMYYDGSGVKQNYAEAAKWYRIAAQQGNAGAQCNLGVMYCNGNSVKQDYYEAIKWYSLAAQQGNAGGQCNLGVMYEKGQGVRQSYTDAIKWFLLAAQQGNAEAQFNLGIFYQ